MREEDARLQKSAKTVWGSGSGCSKSGQRYPPEKSLSTGWWNTPPPPPGATVLSNAYLLDSNLSLTAVDSATHLLNKMGLEL